MGEQSSDVNLSAAVCSVLLAENDGGAVKADKNGFFANSDG
jgi:hypothetical protein